MNGIGLAGALLAISFSVTGCVTTTETNLEAIIAEQTAAHVAGLEAKYGKCRRDRWQSVSVIGKTRPSDLTGQLKACDVWGQVHTSRHVSADRVHFFVHLRTDRMWHFVNGVLVSYRT